MISTSFDITMISTKNRKKNKRATIKIMAVRIKHPEASNHPHSNINANMS